MSARAPSRAALARPAAGVLLALFVTSSAAPAAAEERVVTITVDGVRPSVLQAQPGDTVRFVNEDRSFAYRAQSTGGPWRFDSGPVRLLQDDFAVAGALTQPGTYAYRVAQDVPYRGTVVVGGGAGASAAPSPSTAPAPPPPASPASTAPASPAAQAAPPVQGPLPGGPTSRGLGLPTALAAVLIAGAGSLLLRLLLSEPVLSDRRATV